MSWVTMKKFTDLKVLRLKKSNLKKNLSEIRISWFSPLGSKIWHFLTSDSDSSSKTVYIATWTGLETQNTVKIQSNLKKYFVFLLIWLDFWVLDMPSWLYIQFLMRNPNLRSKIAKIESQTGKTIVGKTKISRNC